MTKLNNPALPGSSRDDYFNVLDHLFQFQKDSGYHNIEYLLGEGDNSYQKSAHYKRVINELRKEHLIETKLGSGSGFVPSITVGNHKGVVKRIGGESEGKYRPLMARITIAGIKEYHRRLSIFNATENPIRQSTHPSKKPQRKVSKSVWEKPPTMLWQVIAVVVAIIFGIIMVLINRGII